MGGGVSMIDFSKATPPFISFFGKLIVESEAAYNFLLSMIIYPDGEEQVDKGIIALKADVVEVRELKYARI